jgi:serine/threonine-protein kinase RsbW
MHQRDTRRDTSSGTVASNDGFLLKLELHSDPQLLCVVRGALERLTEVFGFSPPDRRSVTRAVDEALTNIIRHCYNGRTDQPIQLYCKRVPPRAPQLADGLEILLSDQGPPIDPAKLRGRRLDEIKPGGLGLHFIRQSMDVVEYQRVGTINQFRLVKYLQPTMQSRTP